MSTRLRKFSCFAVASLSLTFGILACRSSVPANPHINEVQWKKFVSQDLGFSLQYPAEYIRQQRDGKDDIFFRYRGSPVLVLRYCDEQYGRSHGLWFGHDAAEEILRGSRKGSKYIYFHGDGPFYVRTVAFAIPYRGKYLRLEFRTELESLDEVQQHILASVQLEQ